MPLWIHSRWNREADMPHAPAGEGMKLKRHLKLLVRWCDQLESRIKELESREYCPMKHYHTPAITTPTGTATTTSPAPAPVIIPDRREQVDQEPSKGLAALFDQQPEQHYRHTCKCGTSVRVNRNPTAVCLKCKQPMQSSAVRSRN